LTYGLEIRRRDQSSIYPTKSCENSAEGSTPQLTPQDPKPGEMDTAELAPDLAEIIAAWPGLPEAIRSAILAAVRASK